ncbi:hypothetical protein PISMIDRAFT_681571 [Pisolithus microcarpus 441]|uniref:Uncharacterized protein n=1 Tax=Pisolithus microcarpus 441 TaxID=765257 RepID=A0A0C9Z595_9AGAM|nr:hypothetical protein PISMIDRAFT_681571 [Pisolithus microcarpus 441]
MVKLSPIFAVRGHQELKKMLSRFVVALARIMRYREHTPSALPSGDQAGEPTGTSWQRLELNAKTGLPAPSSDTYFSFLYCLWPCNFSRLCRILA